MEKIDQAKKENIQKRLQDEMEQKTKSRTTKDDKWERKKYREQRRGGMVKDIIKMRLHMWDLKKNYKKE